VALADGRADLAVHSLEGRADGAAGAASRWHGDAEREDPRDAFVSARTPGSTRCRSGARVGTPACGARRSCRARRPTSIVRACAATSTRGWPSSTAASTTRSCWRRPLKRLAGLADPRADAAGGSLPAVGQGALAIEVLADRADVQGVGGPLNDPRTEAEGRCRARGVARAGRQLPGAAAAYCVSGAQGLRLRALVASEDGTRVARAELADPGCDAQGRAAAGRRRGRTPARAARRRDPRVP
jgi:hydroxymethylbilane synthase